MKKTIGLIIFIAAAQAFGQFAQMPDPARQFDFWIGEWDVNLRVQQPDKTWKDQHKATARIYSILGGKAILELWSEGKDGINGYSRRYYNPEKKKWDLWLNWAGKNRSGTNGLEGEFRHGRGEFFAERKQEDGTTRISRYTFSDITENSLRWDDGYSTDGGKTWASNWIMEFTRKMDKAPEIGSEKNLLTYFDGSRCDLPDFEVLKTVSEKWEQGQQLNLYNILDGCILAGILRDKGDQYFFTLTWNTYANVYELALIDDKPGNPLALYYGSIKADPARGTTLSLKDRDGNVATIGLTKEGGLESINFSYSDVKKQIWLGWISRTVD
ncbi:MAG: hypothetical protein IPM63_09150 [Acidobacteriota bacterium]|nr:MAG: hypothetical protein IPM63_09150 [Acidobacteriota bacterium]